MLRSFLLITFRILWRNKVTSFVNIFSLSVGITAFIFIMLYVHHEMSYDKGNINKDRIYRMEADEYEMLPPTLGTQVSETLPEIEAVSILSRYRTRNFIYIPGRNPENTKQSEVYSVFADSAIFKVFTFSFIQGDPNSALRQPMTVVVTESFAKKLFGEEDPIGKAIEFNHSPYTITGIIQDMRQSHIEMDVLLSMPTLYQMNPERDFNNSPLFWSPTYVLLKNLVDKDLTEKKINDVLAEMNGSKLVNFEFEHFRLTPLSDLYFYGTLQKLSYGLHGNLRNVTIMIAIGFFILVLAGVNYVNLTTARSTVRSKEFAMKRVTGSTVNLLRAQLIGESVILSLLAMVVALTLVQLFLPTYNHLIGISIQIRELNLTKAFVALLGGGLIIGILAGIYPAFYLTATLPTKLIKGAGVSNSDRAFFRSLLMTFQFGLSIILIIAIIVNFQQLNFLRTTDLGFDKQEILLVNTYTSQIRYEEQVVPQKTFKDKLKQYPDIKNVSLGGWDYPGRDQSPRRTPTLEINGVHSSVAFSTVDEDYLDVTGITLTQGRNLTEDGKSVLVNEAFVQEFNLESPVGMKIYQTNSTDDFVEIVGVVRDFHARSLHDKIEPWMLIAYGMPGGYALIRMNLSNIPATIQKIKNEHQKLLPSEPFIYEFLDESFNHNYKNDEQLAKVIGYFTLLAVIIACLGLFALSSFMVSRRIKEIGVRKVLGASVGTIYSMLSWDFLQWILVAIVIACPVAWYLMQMWLETFAYHITIGAEIFIMAALLAIGIALLTITGQSFKAANANPVKSLQYE